MNRQKLFEKMLDLPVEKKDEILSFMFDVIEEESSQDGVKQLYDFIRGVEVS